jgi:hypothetical protein
MKQQFILFRRNKSTRGGKSVFYLEDTVTGKKTSLRTTDRKVAERLLHAHREWDGKKVTISSRLPPAVKKRACSLAVHTLGQVVAFQQPKLSTNLRCIVLQRLPPFLRQNNEPTG